MPDADKTLRDLAGYTMKRAFSAIQSDLNTTLKPFGLRMTTFSALVVIVDNPGLRQSKLAEVLLIERPNLVVIVDELERSELISRDRAKGDRRAYELSATLKGRQLCDKACIAVRAHDARMTEGLSEDECQALIAALRKVEANGSTRDADKSPHVSRA